MLFRCTNADDSSKGKRYQPYLAKWQSIYLKHAKKRLQAQMHGLELTYEDVHTMQLVSSTAVMTRHTN